MAARILCRPDLYHERGLPTIPKSCVSPSCCGQRTRIFKKYQRSRNSLIKRRNRSFLSYSFLNIPNDAKAGEKSSVPFPFPPLPPFLPFLPFSTAFSRLDAFSHASPRGST